MGRLVSFLRLFLVEGVAKGVWTGLRRREKNVWVLSSGGDRSLAANEKERQYGYLAKISARLNMINYQGKGEKKGPNAMQNGIGSDECSSELFPTKFG